MEAYKCEICDTEKSKYCCPKCNVMYCSLKCYKDQRHSQCSEVFYKAAVIEELKIQSTEDDVAQRHQKLEMLKMLQNLDEEDDLEEEDLEELDSDDDEGIDLADRLENVNLNDGDAVWEKLTDAERQEFQNILDSGDILGMVPIKDPWYLTGEEVPEVTTSILEFTKISKKEPADTVKYNLLNIIAAYTYTHRYFLGDYQSYLSEACNCLCILSGSLRKNYEFDCKDAAIKSLFIEGLSYQFEVDTEMELTIIQDLISIIKGPDPKEQGGAYILACLSDMLRMFKSLKTQQSSSDSQVKLPIGTFSKKFHDNINRIPNNFTKSTWATSIRRLEYFLSYTKFYYKSEILKLIH